MCERIVQKGQYQRGTKVGLVALCDFDPRLNSQLFSSPGAGWPWQWPPWLGLTMKLVLRVIC